MNPRALLCWLGSHDFGRRQQKDGKWSRKCHDCARTIPSSPPTTYTRKRRASNAADTIQGKP